jgi:hypothetical protein
MASIARSCGRGESPDDAPLGGSFIEEGRGVGDVDAFIFGEVEAVPEVPGIRLDIISLRRIWIAAVRSSRDPWSRRIRGLCLPPYRGRH